MTDVKSKNLYELLGNDHDQDSDKEPEPPTKTVDKTLGRSGKRDAPREPPKKEADQVPRNRDNDKRRGGFTGSERAFRDNASGRTFNRRQPTERDDGTVRGRDSGPGTQRGGRGQRGPRRGGDRHVNRSGREDNTKQADQSWGQPTGEGEWNDEKAGEAIAQQEVKEGGFDTAEPTPVDGEGNTLPTEEKEPEPEDNSKSYADYLAEQASKKLENLGLKEARAPNEGAKENKKWKSAKELTKQEGESYFLGEGKTKRERERGAKKEFVEIDYSFKEQPRESGGRGGRGGSGRGGRGRGEYRGGERGARGEYRGGRGGGDRPDRGDRPERGDRTERGDRPERGSYRGRGRGGNNTDTSLPVNDQKAFPSLGGN